MIKKTLNSSDFSHLEEDGELGVKVAEVNFGDVWYRNIHYWNVSEMMEDKER